MTTAWHRKLTQGIDFNDREFYGALGFQCGLEIHQQLDTGKKLFCNCPVGYRRDDPDAVILRHMRPTLSEMGTYDGTALMEFKTRKQVIYQLYRDNVCTYEMDDTPPFPVNQEALDYAIEIALMLNCQLVDEVHITRKQYLDGSIPTGFQRTAIIGVNGWIPYRERKIQIQQLALEEDACREVDDQGHTIWFRTDRLSTPLVEIVTKPDMKTPHEAAEVDELLGRLLRASGRVRRGIGTVRQDVNVSISGAERVEIKGVPRTPDIRPLTHYEALRQKALLELRDRLHDRGITPDGFDGTFQDVTPFFQDPEECRRCGIPEGAEQVKAVNLKGWRDLLRHRTQPGITFAAELAGRVRVIACLDNMPNIHVLDNQTEGKLPGELGISIEVEEQIRKKTGAGEMDTLVLVWGPGEDVETGTEEIITRAREAAGFIPQETRQHMADKCRTDFERILPGPDRMYPDTDSAPVAITRDRVERIMAVKAPNPWEREREYRALGLPEHLVRQMAIHPRARLFDRIAKELSLNPTSLAVALVEWQKAIKRDRLGKGLTVHNPDDDQFHDFFKKAGDRKTPRRALYNALERVMDGEQAEPQAPLSPEEEDALCREALDHLGETRFKAREYTLDYLVGKVIALGQGRVRPEEVRKKLNGLLD
ncbi:MAG: Glu-tRNA(Gln) amidotransferase subunit GatE [Deltaproteobacteria bacterium]|nr:Glu-tRNA(Gln) amidotransferase subunit GatE [Deltaproteobacteria bacterium]